MVIMNRLAAVNRQRTEQRRQLALDLARRVTDAAARQGIGIDLIGSLTHGDFGLHSDVDLFVHGDTDPSRRVQVERLVATAFRGAEIPYDIVYASDLTAARTQEFLGG